MGWSARDAGDLSGKVVVVTGGNSGVGFEAARLFVARGAHVVLACRDVAKADAARARIATPDTSRGGSLRGSASVLELDLADLDSVESAAKNLAATHPVVDVLVNNAGVMGGGPMFTAQGHERQMGTNHLGHFALTARVWPLLAAAAGGRVVAVSSIAARGGQLGPSMTERDLIDPQPYRSQAVYSNSKQANLLFAQELHRRAAGSTVRVLAAHPGVSYTNLFLRQLRDEGRGWLVPAARVVMPVLFQSAAAGSLPLVRAAIDPDLRGGEFVGPRRFGQARGAPELLEVYPQGADAAAAERLWSLSESLTGVSVPR